MVQVQTDTQRQEAGQVQEDQIGQSGWKRVNERRHLDELRRIRAGGKGRRGSVEMAWDPVGITSSVLSER